MKTGSESIEATIRRRRILFVGIAVRMVLMHPHQKEGLKVLDSCYKERIINSAA